ncbi:nitroreductase family protein [candidate division KSB1 bacterium]|nr:nitroreductase family protein [candidate division KSB1 bacterium]
MKSYSSLIDLIRARRSTRRFQNRPVPRELLVRCVEAARLAPSAENSQPWRFIIVDDADLLQELRKNAFSGFFRPTRWASAAPVLVVLCARPDIVAGRLARGVTGTHFSHIDLGIAGTHFCLQAQELGLGTCWIGWFDKKRVRRTLKIGRDRHPVILFAVGYSAESASRPQKRKNLDEICAFNRGEKSPLSPAG